MRDDGDDSLITSNPPSTSCNIFPFYRTENASFCRPVLRHP